MGKKPNRVQEEEEFRLLKMGADSLKKMALNEEAKDFILKNPSLFQILKKAANRYIGGETLDEAIASVHAWNKKGFEVTTDYMGESIRNEKEANEATAEFLRFIQAIREKQFNSSVSLDLSHIGLLISKELAIRNLDAICERAEEIDREVILSMEGTDRTDDILEIYKSVSKERSNLGITLQAYLYRTRDDFKELLNLPGSIRLVKGAYETAKNLSMPRGEKLDEVYMNYTEQLLSKNHRCSIASHHDSIHEKTLELIHRYQPTNYVLERLLGIGNEKLEVFRAAGYNCRIYIVYGREWYLYLCNRLAEYPLNLFRAIADIADLPTDNVEN